MSRLFNALNKQIVSVLILMFVIGISVVMWHVTSLQSRLVESTALKNARLFTESLVLFRNTYSSEVVARIRGHEGVIITHDYLKQKNSIPLPATLSMKLGDVLRQTHSGAYAKLYSDYPFPWRLATGGLRDAFEWSAWKALTQTPNDPFYSFEEADGKPVLRYAVADRMKKSCLTCHNTHKDSPKHDWKEGEVRGVLEVVYPLESVVEGTQSDLAESFVVVGGIGALGLFVLGLVIHHLKQTSKNLELHVKERTAELKSANIELSAAEQYQSNILQSILDTLIVINANGTIRVANSATLKLLGYTEQELLGKHMDEVLVPEEDHTEGSLSHMLSSEITQGIEISYLSKSGEKILMMLSYAVMDSEKGKGRGGLVCVAQDIRERKQAEIQLQKWQHVFQFAGWGITISRADEAIIEMANPYYHKMLGYELGELSGVSTRQLYAPEVRSEVGEYIKKAHNEGHINFETKQIKKNGEVIPVQLDVSSPRDAEGNIMYRVANIQNISKRKHDEWILNSRHEALVETNKKLKSTQAQLIQSAKLASLGEMATGVAHELNQPLFAISLEAEDLFEEMTQTPQIADSSRPEKILKMVDRASKIINHLRTFGRDTGRSQFREADMHHIIEGAFTLIREQLKIQGIEVVEVRWPEPLTVVCEPFEIEQVLTNLLANARDALQHSEEKKITIRSFIQDVWVGVEVVDTGPGIDPAKQQKIFDPFFTTKEVGKGTGLGLSISHGIVEKHVGRLEVESDLGEGARFCLYLPIQGSPS